MTITGDIIVYADSDGRHSLATLDDGETWWRWPAELHGWRSRTRCQASAAEPAWELDSHLASLALRLSGVDRPV